MFRILVKKCFHEALLLWCACALVLFFFPWIRIWTVSQFELSGFEPILKQFRAFEKFSPVPLEQFLSYHGVIGLTFDEPVLLLCVLVWSISRGSDVISGELGRGTMEMMLAQPISRRQIFLAHALVTISGLALLCVLVFAGMACGIHTNSTPVGTSTGLRIPFLNMEVSNPFQASTTRLVPLSELVSARLFVVPTMNLFGLGFMMLGLSVMYSAFDQYRWRTIGFVIGTYVLQLLLFILAKSTPSMAFLKPFSFLAAYQPDWIVQTVYRKQETTWAIALPQSDGVDSSSWSEQVGPLGYVLILVTLGCVLYSVAYHRFLKRDLPAPM
jgi:ABC-2 type transport system permease protein